MSIEHDLARYLRDEVQAPLPAAPGSLHSIEAMLGELPPEELASRLQDKDDAEALPLRELLLFPDLRLVRDVERWLLERNDPSEAPDGLNALDADALANGLEGAVVCVQLAPDLLLKLKLDAAEARQFVSRLHVQTPLPAAVRQAVEETAQELGHKASQDKTALAVLARCRRARFDWTAAKEQFMARVVTGLARGVPGRPAEAAGMASRLLEAVDWSTSFLEHTDDDIATHLGLRRNVLLDLLQQAQREDKLRATHNFETRRMLGMVESYIQADDVRRELGLLDDVARATGGLPLTAQSQVVHQNLDQVGEVKDVEDMQRLLGLLGGE